MLVKLPFNATKSVAGTGGDVTFAFKDEWAQAYKRAMPGSGNPPPVLVRELKRLVIDHAITIVQANGAGAVKLADLPFLMQYTLLRNFERRSSTVMYDAVDGQALRQLEYIRGEGILPRRSISPNNDSDIGANSSGSAVTTSVTIRLVIYFDRPSARASNGKGWALSAFHTGGLEVRVGSIASVFADANLSITSHTISLAAECAEVSSVAAGEDYRVRYQTGKTTETGAVTAFELDAGVYEYIGWCPGKIGNTIPGGHAYTLLTKLDGSRYDFQPEFDQLTGAKLMERFWMQGGDMALRDSNSPLGVSGVFVPLTWIPRNAESDFPYLLAREGKIKFDLDTGSSLSNPHRFLTVERRIVDDEEHRTAAGRVGIVTGSTEAKPHSDPASTRERALMFRREIKAAG